MHIEPEKIDPLHTDNFYASVEKILDWYGYSSPRTLRDLVASSKPTALTFIRMVLTISFAPPTNALDEIMQKKHTLIIAQIFISLMMAFLMTGIFSFVELGMTKAWLYTWMKHFVTAWPIAFVLSIYVGTLGFKLANKVTS